MDITWTVEDTKYSMKLESQLTKKQKQQLKRAKQLVKQRGYKFAELVAMPIHKVTKEVLEFWFVDTTLARIIFVVVDGTQFRVEEDSIYNVLDKAEELKQLDEQ